MQFLYHPDSGNDQILLMGDEYRYIVKVRRHKIGDDIALRNLRDDNIHLYQINTIDKKSASLSLAETRILKIAPSKPLHIGWCIIDPKKIEKTLPALNEIGVSEITFIRCDRSQNNFKIDQRRLDTILLNSSQQCGRSVHMRLSFAKNLEQFITSHPESFLLNFSENKLSCDMDIDTIVVGCEGGLTDEEIALFDPSKIVGLNTPTILRSENATFATASLLLL